jgi:Zn-dependent protease with chaperone function
MNQKNKHKLLQRGAQGLLLAGAAAAAVLSGVSGAGIAVMGAVTVLPVLRSGSKRVGAAMLAQFRGRYDELHPGDELYERVARLSAQMGLKKTPHVFRAPASITTISALSASTRVLGGKGVDAVVLPAGMFTSSFPGRPPVFTPDEQDAVIAHELAHIRNGDSARGQFNRAAMGFTALAGALAGVMALGNPAVPLGGMMVCLWMMVGGIVVDKFASRRTELLTDAAAAEVTGKPLALIGALQKMHRILSHMDAFTANATQITKLELPRGGEAIMFRAKKAAAGAEDAPVPLFHRMMGRMLSTHPEKEARYRNLETCAAEAGRPVTRGTEPDMSLYLHRTADDIILPPFAVPTLVHQEEITGRTMAITASSAFNRAARGDAADDMPPAPPRRDGDGPQPRP